MKGLIKGLVDVALGGNERRGGDGGDDERNSRDERSRSTWDNVVSYEEEDQSHAGGSSHGRRQLSKSGARPVEKTRLQKNPKYIFLYRLSKIYPKDVEAPAGGVDDMIKLSYLHEPGVLQNLKIRYELNEIYTYIGNILIEINPFQLLPHIYDATIQRSTIWRTKSSCFCSS